MQEHPLPDLDTPEVYQEIDPQGARERIFDLAGQCRRAWDLVTGWTPPALPVPPRAVLIVGMGGSAIGGDLLRALAMPMATVPIIVHRDYGLPAYAGPHTLVLACSFSGNTEETLSAAREARQRGSPIVALTTGGELERLGYEWAASVLPFSYEGAQPRESLGYMLLLLLGILVRLDLLPDLTPEVERAMDTLRALQREVAPAEPQAQNQAKALARWLYGHLPLVCGAGLLAPVARRWKAQFNENSKAWAAFETLPEMDHNAVAGTFHPLGFGAAVRAIFLSSDDDHERNRRRQQVTCRILEQAGTACRTMTACGDSPLARLLSLVLLGDACSYYLAILYRTDPTPIPPILALKAALAGEPAGV